jgi:hypothetical protein
LRRLENLCGEWHFRPGHWERSHSRSNPAQFAPRTIRENSMLDLIMLLLGLGFFAAAIGYTYACERL